MEHQRLFHVRRRSRADGSAEWYVLNGHTRRRASGTFKTKAEAEARRAELQDQYDQARKESSRGIRRVTTLTMRMIKGDFVPDGISRALQTDDHATYQYLGSARARRHPRNPGAPWCWPANPRFNGKRRG